MNSRGQNALEYLLLIGGAVLISTVILLLALGTAPVGNLFLSNQLGQYGQIGNSIPSPPITGPPIISTFNLSPDSTPASLRADISLANVGPGTTIRFLAWNAILTPTPLSIATFSAQSTNDWSYQTTLPANQSSTQQFSINEILPQANHSYDAAILVCNSPNLFDCTLAQATGMSGAPSNGPASSSGNITVAFGSPEIVWDTITNPSEPDELILYNAGGVSCNPGDIPDMPTRSLVTASGELLLFRGNSWENRFMRGTTFSISDLTTDCTDPAPYDSHVPVTFFTSTSDTYRDREWIGAIYRDPADTSGVIHALIHNEYHDPRSSSDPPCREGFASPANRCNYFSITHAISTDNGFTFTPSSPDNIVAASHLAWDPFVLPPGLYPSYGIMMNSNILKRGSYFYLLVHAINDSFPDHATRGICVGRTNNLNDPSSWRFWDGTSYSIRQGSPYATPSEAPATPCVFVGKNQIDQMTMSIVYSTYLKKYLIVSPSNTPGGAPCGAFFATSDDLITWSPRQLMYPMAQSSGPCAVANPPYQSYASLIDHTQLGEAMANIDPNFEKIKQTAHLYYVHTNSGLNRDLERVLITFCDQTQGVCP